MKEEVGMIHQKRFRYEHIKANITDFLQKIFPNSGILLK
jgi:hypothetical protein